MKARLLTGGFLFLALAAWAAEPAPNPPKAADDSKPAVVELFDDEADSFAPLLDNGGAVDNAQAGREDRDKYTGVCSLRVTPLQRFSPSIKGWNFPIVEKPQPGQYRYLRFAWKKIGGTGIMVQICQNNGTWEQRYVAGVPTQPWPAKKIAEKMPAEWELVTRDLFQDFGAFTMTGMAFTPMDGTAGLYDHIYLGRSIEDLDKVSNATLGKTPNKEALTEEKLKQLWKELASRDASVSAPAAAALTQGPKESVPFLKKQLEPAAASEDEKRVTKLIRDLDNDDFDVREAASANLKKLGPAVFPALEKALKDNPSVEVARRIVVILGKDTSGGVAGISPEVLHKIRAIRVLERAGTPEAKSALEELSKGNLELGLGQEVKLALARLAKK